MNKLDPHTLFSIFEKGDEEVYKENNVQELLNNPYVLIGMVVTGMENYQLIDKMYCHKYVEEYSRVRDEVKFKYFTRLYTYLDRVSVKEFDKAYTIGNDFEIDRALNIFIDLLYYFQDIEHYEKCIEIKRFIDLLLDKKLEKLI